jgi:hypothetical protein
VAAGEQCRFAADDERLLYTGLDHGVVGNYFDCVEQFIRELTLFLVIWPS